MKLDWRFVGWLKLNLSRAVVLVHWHGKCRYVGAFFRWFQRILLAVSTITLQINLIKFKGFHELIFFSQSHPSTAISPLKNSKQFINFNCYQLMKKRRYKHWITVISRVIQCLPSDLEKCLNTRWNVLNNRVDWLLETFNFKKKFQFNFDKTRL